MPLGAVAGSSMAANPRLYSGLSRSDVAIPTALEIKLTTLSYCHRYLVGQVEYQDVYS
jgi:hypothetical protein